jgi:hypothetical protein
MEVNNEKKKLIVKIEVINKVGELETEFFTNYYTKEGTVRIAKCAFWALSNGFTVVTRPIENNIFPETN